MKKENKEKIKNYTIFFFSLLVLLAIWQQLVDSKYIDSIFISKPTAIFASFVNLVEMGVLAKDFYLTLQEVMVGFVIGSLSGLALGLLFSWKKILAKIFMPYVYLVYGTPFVALVPLIILWFGISIIFKIVAVVITVVPVVIIHTYEGTRTVDRDIINLLKTMKFSNFQIVQKVVFPSSLFFIFTSLRIAFGRAMVIALVAEFSASNAGLGYLIQYSANTFNTSSLLVGVIVASATSLVAFRLLDALEKYIIKWKPNQN